MAASGSRTLLPGRWYRVRVTLPRGGEDDAAGIAAWLGGAGNEIRPAGPRRVEFGAWFDAEDCARAAAVRLAGLSGARLETPAPEAIEDPGWLAASLAPREALRAGRFVVRDRPRQGEKTEAGTLEIVLPPGRAFGSGEHATTRLCLELLERWLRPHDAVLDLGTGSGILAIAAARLDASSVEAIDNDETVIEVAQENVEANGLAGRVRVAAGSWGSVSRSRRFDLVVANIHRSAVTRAAPSLTHRLKARGRAILSGFLDADRALVENAWSRAGCALVEARTAGEWAALAVAKSAQP